MDRHMGALREYVTRFVKDNGYTQEKAAEKLGISRPVLMGLMKPNRKDVNLGTVFTISESMGVSIPELIGCGGDGA